MPLEMGHPKGGGAWSLSRASWRKGLEMGAGTGVPSATSTASDHRIQHLTI